MKTYSGNDFLSSGIHQIDTSAIRRVFDLAAHIQNPLNLSIGQPDFPVPLPVKEAMAKAIFDNKNSYTPTQGILPLREAISRKWQQQGFVIDPANIVVSAGVASLLYLLYEVLFDEGDEIILIDPYFLIYDSLASYHQLKVTYLPENFGPAEIAALPAFKKLKAIIFSSPSNPSGKIMGADQLSLLVELARKNGALVVSDEIYEAFDYEQRFVSTASLFPEGTITLNGFSKSHAMTGLRVGYLGVPENLAAISQKVATLQQYSIVCSPAPAQWAAITALETPIGQELAIMKKRRDLVVEKLAGVVNLPRPEGAFYAFMPIPVDSQLFVEKAIERKLLVVPGYIFSQNRNSLRISYAVNEEMLARGLDVLAGLIDELKA